MDHLETLLCQRVVNLKRITQNTKLQDCVEKRFGNLRLFLFVLKGDFDATAMKRKITTQSGLHMVIFCKKYYLTAW